MKNLKVIYLLQKKISTSDSDWNRQAGIVIENLEYFSEFLNKLSKKDSQEIIVDIKNKVDSIRYKIANYGKPEKKPSVSNRGRKLGSKNKIKNNKSNIVETKPVETPIEKPVQKTNDIWDEEGEEAISEMEDEIEQLDKTVNILINKIRKLNREVERRREYFENKK